MINREEKFMKYIFCYGDFNIYGFNLENGGRYDYNECWIGVL